MFLPRDIVIVALPLQIHCHISCLLSNGLECSKNTGKGVHTCLSVTNYLYGIRYYNLIPSFRGNSEAISYLANGNYSQE